ncbi:unnamed protein product [Haemonchus placei]|uniref:HintN domain-containing protein n=1 Tax=Haemonchus placei TaxID=6290 RepID=A0A0N4WS69_HAEPC|nr:unnamed protein product [Haemonchus placei]
MAQSKNMSDLTHGKRFALSIAFFKTLISGVISSSAIVPIRPYSVRYSHEARPNPFADFSTMWWLLVLLPAAAALNYRCQNNQVLVVQSFGNDTIRMHCQQLDMCGYQQLRCDYDDSQPQCGGLMNFVAHVVQATATSPVEHTCCNLYNPREPHTIPTHVGNDCFIYELPDGSTHPKQPSSHDDTPYTVLKSASEIPEHIDGMSGYRLRLYLLKNKAPPTLLVKGIERRLNGGEVKWTDEAGEKAGTDVFTTDEFFVSPGSGGSKTTARPVSGGGGGGLKGGAAGGARQSLSASGPLAGKSGAKDTDAGKSAASNAAGGSAAKAALARAAVNQGASQTPSPTTTPKATTTARTTTRAPSTTARIRGAANLAKMNCFPADAVVTTVTGQKRMDQVAVGDFVLVPSAGDVLKYERVEMFYHREPETRAQFVVLFTASKKRLALTPLHLLPFGECQSMKRDLEKADGVDKWLRASQFAHKAVVGDCVMTVSDSGEVVVDRIVKVCQVWQRKTIIKEKST